MNEFLIKNEADQKLCSTSGGGGEGMTWYKKETVIVQSGQP